MLVLSYNGKHLLRDCLPSVLSMAYPEFEVVVIDNGSSDGTKEYVNEEFPTVHLVEISPNQGYSRGFNAGLEYAAGRCAQYFLIMNNDTVIDREALSALVETATERDHVGFVTGKVYFMDHPETLQTVGKCEDPVLWNGKDMGWGERDNGQYDVASERVFADDVFALVSREMYDQVGGYDPGFFLHCEEWDWQLRARKKGWKIYFTPNARIWHRLSATTGGLGSPLNEYFLARNRLVVLAKHGGMKRVIRYSLWAGSESLTKMARAIAQFDWSKLRPRLARFLGLLAGGWWLVRRRPSFGPPRLVKRLNRAG